MPTPSPVRSVRDQDVVDVPAGLRVRLEVVRKEEKLDPDLLVQCLRRQGHRSPWGLTPFQVGIEDLIEEHGNDGVVPGVEY